MNFDEARNHGERAIDALRAKFRQDLGNARFIGRFSVAGLVAKLRPVPESQSPSVAPAAPSVESFAQVPGSPPDFAILSAAELIDLLDSCTPERAREILAHEEGHLRRTAVLDAARRRAGQ